MNISHAGSSHCLVPNAARICNPSTIPQCSDQRKNIPQRHVGMNGDEPVPYFESILGVSVCRLIPNHIDVGLANGWQKAIEGEFDARTGTQEAGKGFCSPLGVSFDGMSHFGES